jgi:DNA-directed RNA polymerase I, II, and III subunit RPABC2
MDNKTLSKYEQTLTKFEKARVIGQRAMQLSLGAPPLVDITGMQDALEIAKKELRENKIPIIIRRTYPNGETREFAVSEMNSNF